MVFNYGSSLPSVERAETNSRREMVVSAFFRALV
jgi:hypothetical protein